MKPGLCPSPGEVDSQDLSSNCDDDASCHGTKKCCKANTGAMLCLKAASTNGMLIMAVAFGLFGNKLWLFHCALW